MKESRTIARKTQRHVVALCVNVLQFWITTLEINATVCNICVTWTRCHEHIETHTCRIQFLLLTINWDLFAIIFYYFIRCIWKKCARRHWFIWLYLVSASACMCNVYVYHIGIREFCLYKHCNFCIHSWFTHTHTHYGDSMVISFDCAFY